MPFSWKLQKIHHLTLPETNIAPENRWLEDDPFLLGWPIFRGRTVSFRECNSSHFQSVTLHLFSFLFFSRILPWKITIKPPPFGSEYFWSFFQASNMQIEVGIIRGTPKWMVYNGKPY